MSIQTLTRFATLDYDRIRKIVLARTCFVNTKLGPILTKTKVINFMTKIGLRLGMLVNTAPGVSVVADLFHLPGHETLDPGFD